MAAAKYPITVKKVRTLPSIDNNTEFTSTHVTMESENYICIRQRNSVVIFDMDMPMKPFSLKMQGLTVDSALMHPNSRILALKDQILGTVQHRLRLFNIEKETKIKSYMMPEQVTFWKWISPEMLGLVTQTSVYHWSLKGDSEPIKMFERTANLANKKIINYQCDPTGKWLVLIGIAPGTPERPQLVNGNMQLFSVDQQCSQAVKAHAASFAQFKVPGNENPSVLLSFAIRTLNDAGQVISELHVVELVAQPGKPSFTKKKANLFFPPNFADDFPISMLMSHKYGLIYVISNQGLLFVYDLETATAVFTRRISPDPIFLTSEATSVGGLYAVNRRGQVVLATVNEQTIVNFVRDQLNNLELAVSLAKRGNLPGAEKLEVVVERFHELFAQTKYKEAAELAAESPQGILRTRHTVAKFQSVPVQAGETSPLQLYFGALLKKGKLDAFESLELSRLVVKMNKKNLLRNWLAKDKLECSEELGDLVKTVDNDLALEIYMKAVVIPKVVAALAERREFDKMLFDSTQVDEATYKFAEHAPPFAKQLANQAKGFIQKVTHKAEKVVNEGRSKGPRAAVDYVAKESKHLLLTNSVKLWTVLNHVPPFHAVVDYVAKESKHLLLTNSVKLWTVLNHVPPFHAVAEMAVPIAAHWSEKYNRVIQDLTQKGYSVAGFLPLIPVEEISEAFKQGEANLKRDGTASGKKKLE